MSSSFIKKNKNHKKEKNNIKIKVCYCLLLSASQIAVFILFFNIDIHDFLLSMFCSLLSMPMNVKKRTVVIDGRKNSSIENLISTSIPFISHSLLPSSALLSLYLSQTSILYFRHIWLFSLFHISSAFFEELTSSKAVSASAQISSLIFMSSSLCFSTEAIISFLVLYWVFCDNILIRLLVPPSILSNVSQILVSIIDWRP